MIGVLQGTLPENTDMEFISKTTFNAVSSVSIDNCFSASYTHYLVTRNFSASATDNTVDVRLRVSGTDDTGTNYRRQYVEAFSTTIGATRSTGQSLWAWGMGDTEATAIGFLQLRISNPFEAVRTTAWVDNVYRATGNIELFRNVYAHDSATSYTGFSVIPAAGTITGSITVYGIAV
jgi:hypothetical protein